MLSIIFYNSTNRLTGKLRGRREGLVGKMFAPQTRGSEFRSLAPCVKQKPQKAG